MLYSSLNNPETTTLSLIQKVAADVNGDSLVDGNDASYLNEFLSGTITALPSSVKLINCGDVNLDGGIDNSDFDLLYAYIFNVKNNPLNINQIFAADTNEDGKINLIDASIIRKYVVGAMNYFPMELS